MFPALLTPAAKAVPRSFSLTEQATALGILLRKEFGIPFVFYRATTGESVQDRPIAPSDSWRVLEGEPLPRLLAPDEVQRLAADSQPEVSLVADGRYQLTMVFYDGHKPLAVAAGLFVGLAKNKAETEREQRWLQQWLQSVSDRLRLNEQFQRQQQVADDQHSQARTAWEALLGFDHVLRRLRIHKEPLRNRQRILETAHGLLGTQSLAWVPRDPQLAVQSAGDSGFTPEEFRRLATVLAKHTDMQTTGHVLWSHSQAAPWAVGFPTLDSVMAFAIGDADAPGWVLALNKKGPETADETPVFRRGDAALLTPFVALIRLHASSSGRYQELKDLMVGLARSLTAAIDAKDSYTYGHSERVARIGVELGRAMGLEADELSDIYLAGLLHDVGKIGIQDAVLRKADPLTPEEYEHVKQHVSIGYTILSELKPIRNLLPGVLYHHERWDGKGYPNGLAGEAIPLLARILAVADAYDAMSTTRPYREALPCREVEDRILKGAGTQWDAKVVDAFARCRQKVHAIRQRGVGESLRTALDAALRNADLSTSVAF